MEPISLTIAAAAWLSSTAVSGYIGNRADAICDRYFKKKAEEFKKIETPINHDLQKAILSSHWLATKVLCQELQTITPSDIFNAILVIEAV